MRNIQQTTTPAATLIIPQYGRADLTLAVLRSLRCFDPIPWPVLIVDDGSPDDSVARVTTVLEAGRERLGPVQLLQRPHQGLSAAWNAAALVATTQTLVFLNNDVIVQGPFLDDLVAPLLWNDPPLMTGVKTRRERALPPGTLARLPCTTFLEGWCLAIARPMFLDVGGFDERMALYWSDTDLQCRLAARISPKTNNDGLVPWHTLPRLPIRHLGHRTTHAQPWASGQWRRDRRVFLRKWAANRPSNPSSDHASPESSHAAPPADL